MERRTCLDLRVAIFGLRSWAAPRASFRSPARTVVLPRVDAVRFELVTRRELQLEIEPSLSKFDPTRGNLRLLVPLDRIGLAAFRQSSDAASDLFAYSIILFGGVGSPILRSLNSGVPYDVVLCLFLYVIPFSLPLLCHSSSRCLSPSFCLYSPARALNPSVPLPGMYSI